jgi:FMN phosphatase YigB (HAD superfamily)
VNHGHTTQHISYQTQDLASPIVRSTSKPDPRFFRVVRDALGALVPDAAQHEIVWVDDSDRRGVAPALQYGWNAAWVGGDLDDRLAAVPGVRVIATVAELPAALGLSR